MRLIPLTREFAIDLARGDFAALHCKNLAQAETHLRGLGKVYVDFYDRVAPAPPWIGYLAEVADDIVGSCGYKGNCCDGVVEIAYYTFPEYENRGLATEMARLLTQLSWQQAEVQIVRAHTLREENASVRLLRRLGFDCLGTVEDPEDGPVWRWEIRRF